MALSKVLTGARALIYVSQSNNTSGSPTATANGGLVLVGIFESCTWNEAVGTESIHVLGRYSPSEITPTSYEAVTVNCNGFRVAGQGVHTLPQFPRVSDILNFESVTIAIVDRQTGANIMTVLNCVPTATNTNANARATSRVTVSYTGTAAHDETGDGTAEGANSNPF